MNELELRAWISFVDVMKNFLGHRQVENFKELEVKAIEKSTEHSC